MQYSGAPWTLDGVRHVDVLQELLDAGLEPGGCLSNDLSPERDGALVRRYADDVRSFLLEEMGRPVPVLISPDRVVAVEVSDMFGAPSVRMRTFLADGSLVETGRRWERVPPWPGRAARFRRFATVEREMSRSVAPGRTLVISDRPPAGQLADHRRHVETEAAARGTTPARYADIESVAAGWNAAFEHDRAVARRSDNIIAAGLVVVGLVVIMIEPYGVLGGLGWVLATVALVAALWWVLPGLVLALRTRITWRPAFRADLTGVP